MAIRLLVVLVALVAGGALAEETSRTVTVTGEGVVAAAPDMASVTLGVTVRARTAREALSRNSEAMSEVIAQAGAAGIEARDVQTSQLSLMPAWERVANQTPRIAGYDAANIVTVRVRDLPKLGGLLDALSTAGANSIQSIDFGFLDDAEMVEQARKAAIADAIARAGLYAEGAGARLGKVLTITEYAGGGAPQPMKLARAQEMAMDVPIAGGEMAITAQVSATFRLE